MSQRAREKIALMVFVALIFVVISGGIWYINVGHNWNTAATTIDDATGSMEGYTALVFDGVDIPTAEEAATTTTPVTRASVLASYHSKNATVVSLNLINTALYDEGLIIKANSKRIGVFCVDSAEDASTYQNIVRAFQRQEVDFVVCITSDKQLLSGSTTGISGIDIVISKQRNTNSALDGTLGSAYCVDSPCVGKIGVILISPSNVVSSKVVS